MRSINVMVTEALKVITRSKQPIRIPNPQLIAFSSIGTNLVRIYGTNNCSSCISSQGRLKDSSEFTVTIRDMCPAKWRKSESRDQIEIQCFSSIPNINFRY